MVKAKAPRQQVKDAAARILGEPEPEFTMLNSERIDLIHALNYYARGYNYEDSKKFALSWAEVNEPHLCKGLLRSSPYEIKNIGFICRILSNGFVDEGLEYNVRTYLTDIASKSKDPVQDEKIESHAKKVDYNPLLEAFDYAIDAICTGTEPTEVGLTDSRKHLTELRGQVEKLRNEVTDYKEAYPKWRAILKFLSVLDDRIDNILKSAAKNRVRTIKPKKIDPLKMVARLAEVIGKHDPELDVKTVRPSELIGAKRAILWNPERRTLTSYIAMNEDGLLVSGRSIKNFDPDKSIMKKIRKPQEMWLYIRLLSSTKTHIWLRDECKTTETPARAGVPDGTLILKI